MSPNPDRSELLRPAMLCVAGVVFWLAVMSVIGQQPEKQSIGIPFTDMEITYRWTLNWE